MIHIQDNTPDHLLLPRPTTPWTLKSKSYMPDRFSIRAGSTDRKIGPWLACVLSAALPLGFAVLMTAIGAILSLTSLSVENEHYHKHDRDGGPTGQAQPSGEENLRSARPRP